MELNPNHPVTAKMREQDLWHKIVALVMHHVDRREITLTAADIEALGNDKCVVLHAKKDTIVLSLVTIEEGERMARKHGGLPT